MNASFKLYHSVCFVGKDNIVNIAGFLLPNYLLSYKYIARQRNYDFLLFLCILKRNY